MEEDEIEKVLTVQDRCDSCSSQAYFVTVFDTGNLYFCRHHFIEKEEALREKAYYIIDESEYLARR